MSTMSISKTFISADTNNPPTKPVHIRIYNSEKSKYKHALMFLTTSNNILYRPKNTHWS